MNRRDFFQTALGGVVIGTRYRPALEAHSCDVMPFPNASNLTPAERDWLFQTWLYNDGPGGVDWTKDTIKVHMDSNGALLID